MYNSDLGEVIRLLRISSDQSKKDLALKADISISYLTELENGTKQKPSIDVLDRISDALGVDELTLRTFEREFKGKSFDPRKKLLLMLSKIVDNSVSLSG